MVFGGHRIRAPNASTTNVVEVGNNFETKPTTQTNEKPSNMNWRSYNCPRTKGNGKRIQCLRIGRYRQLTFPSFSIGDNCSFWARVLLGRSTFELLLDIWLFESLGCTWWIPWLFPIFFTSREAAENVQTRRQRMINVETKNLSS